MTAIVQTYFLEQIKGWVERQKLELAHGQKIVEEMVKHLHEFAQKHYMPLGRTAVQFSNSCTRGEWADAFYFFILHQYHRNKLVDEGGGYFLRNATAEVVLSRLGREGTDAIAVKTGRFERWELDRLVSDLLVSPAKSDRPKFQGKIKEGWGEDAFARFCSMMQQRDNRDVASGQKAMRAYSSLLLLETNLGYGAWYGEIHADLAEDSSRRSRRQ